MLMGLQEAINNIWSSDYVQSNPRKSYKNQYAQEYGIVAAYLAGGAEPNWSTFTKIGKGLCEAEKVRRGAVVTPPDPVPPDPTPVGNPYFDGSVASGKIGPPWVSMFYPGNPGYVDLTQTGPQSQTPDGRVKVVDNPFGGSGKVVRCEIQNSDPPWAATTTVPIHKAEFRTGVSQTFNGPFVMGMEWWMRCQIGLPDEFGLCKGGGNPFTDIGDLHNHAATKWPTISFTSWGNSTDITMQVDGGSLSTGSYEAFKLFPLDAAHRNRMIDIVIGAKLHNSAGWIEVWADGKNVVPRKNRPTVWDGETGPYWKQGLYKEVSASFPNGKSVVYHGPAIIGKTKADIGM
jgi:hypothetical protein